MSSIRTVAFSDVPSPDDLLSLQAAEGEASRARLLLITRVCAALLTALGMLVLLGWALRIEALMAVLPGRITMKPNTALGFIFSGLALGTRSQGSKIARRCSWVLAALTLSLGALTLVEFVFGVDLRFDQLLFSDPMQLTFPGRMALITSINFTLAGTSLLLLNGDRAARIISQTFALLIGAVALTAIVGSLYGVEIFYGSLNYKAMALHTGLGFLILANGLVLAQPDSTLVRTLWEPGRGGRLARKLLPAVILVPILLGWVYLHPTINFGRPRFGVALFAVTLSAAGVVGLWAVGIFLDREQRQLLELEMVRRRSEAAVRQSERELLLITDNLPTLLSYIDADGRFRRVNRMYEQWMGKEASSIVGRSVRELFGEEYWAACLPAYQMVLHGETVSFETVHPGIAGDKHALVTYAPDKDEANHVRGFACMVLDVDERHRAAEALTHSASLEEANERLQILATTDQLTCLKNRRSFDERLRADFALAKRHQRKLSVMLLDIDNFKARNDRWGHAAGDSVLKALGTILMASVRAPDLAARYGGEEFIILLPESSSAQAAVVAGRIRQRIFEFEWSDAPLTVSIGIAEITAQTFDGDQLVKAADDALYKAKHTGRDRICISPLPTANS